MLRQIHGLAEAFELRANSRPRIGQGSTRQILQVPGLHAFRLPAEQLIQRTLPWGMLTQLHRDPIRTNLQNVAIVEAHRHIATQR
ncbi:hypothetical protein D3C85_1714190 [compost metagenome]